MACIAVSGNMLRLPLAGNVASCLHYVLGLRMLGHDVLYLEEKGWRNACLDPETGTADNFPRAGLARVRQVLEELGADVPVVWVDVEAGLVEGMLWPQLRECLAATDLALDVGAPCRLEELRLARVRALVDVDPLFTQAADRGRLDHDLFFTYGVNVGRPGCGVPTGGVEWLPTVPPVIPSLWKAQRPRARSALHTVAEWTAYGGVEHDGSWYGQQDGELERLIDLPGRVPVTLELALSGAPAGVCERFVKEGWAVRDPVGRAGSLADHCDHIHSSLGQLHPGKHAHVVTRSGFFSDRSAHYLAAGRPVVMQDTGVGEWLEAGAGVLTFETVAEAARAAETVLAELPKHSLAARSLAHEVFHYGRVLERLVDRALYGRIGAAA